MNRFYKFMYGRYGIDELYKFLFWVYIVIFLINLFLKSNILSLIGTILVVVIIYRCFSKKIYQRKRENNLYLKLKKKFLKPFKNIIRNFKERKTTVYKKCRKCKTTLKLPLPSSRGICHAKCPECKNRVTFLCLRKEKVEIITDKGRGKI